MMVICHQQIVKIDVRIGRNRNLSGFLATGVSNGIAIRTPGQFLYATEWLGRTFIGFSSNMSTSLDIFCRQNQLQKGGEQFLPITPMFVHQVIDQSAEAWGKSMYIFDGSFYFHVGYQNDLPLVR